MVKSDRIRQKVPVTDLSKMVPGAGVEPARCFHRGIFLPTTAFAATGFDPVFVVWTFSLPYYACHNLGRSRQVSTLSFKRI